MTTPDVAFVGLTPDEIEAFTAFAIERALEGLTTQDVLRVRFADVVRSEDEWRNEEWRALPSIPDYEVSDLGRVRRKTSGKLLTQSVTATGHRHVSPRINGKNSPRYVHRLVAEVFLYSDKHPGQDQVNHKDGNPANNAVTNLEWTTQKENLGQAVAQGLRRTGENHPLALKKRQTVLSSAKLKVTDNYIRWLTSSTHDDGNLTD